jgi:hypothetical protein
VQGSRKTMASWYERAVQASFKQTDDGIVFQCPNPWLLGWRSFRVNEAQKESLAVCLRERQRLILRLLAIYLLVAFGLTMLFQWKGVPSDLPTADFIAIVVLTLLGMLAIALVPHLLFMRRIRPLLAELQRADEPMTLHQQLFGVAAVISNLHLALGGLGGFLVAVSNINSIAQALAEGQPLSDLSWPLFGVLAGVLLASYFLYLAILKWRLKRETN